MTVVANDRIDLRGTLVDLLSREWRIPAEKVDCDRPLTEYGLDSITALTVSGELEDMLGIELPTTLLWDCPTVNSIAGFLQQSLQAVSPAALRQPEADRGSVTPQRHNPS